MESPIPGGFIRPVPGFPVPRNERRPMKTLASPTAGAVTAARRSGVALAALACSAAVTVKAEDGLDRAPNSADAADAAVPAEAAPASAVPPAAGPLMAALPPGLPERRQAGPPPANTEPEAVLVAGSADALVAALGDAGVSYSAARDADMRVPRVRVAALPDDLDALDSVRQRKAAFFNTVLPIILQVNEAILADRAGLADLRADGKWPDYGPFCDRFYFAVDADFPREALPATTGLIIADGFGGAVLREADPTPLAAARRKAMTLRFARAVARRICIE